MCASALPICLRLGWNGTYIVAKTFYSLICKPVALVNPIRPQLLVSLTLYWHFSGIFLPPTLPILLSKPQTRPQLGNNIRNAGGAGDVPLYSPNLPLAIWGFNAGSTVSLHDGI